MRVLIKPRQLPLAWASAWLYQAPSSCSLSIISVPSRNKAVNKKVRNNGPGTGKNCENIGLYIWVLYKYFANFNMYPSFVAFRRSQRRSVVYARVTPPAGPGSPSQRGRLSPALSALPALAAAQPASGRGPHTGFLAPALPRDKTVACVASGQRMLDTRPRHSAARRLVLRSGGDASRPWQ